MTKPAFRVESDMTDRVERWLGARTDVVCREFSSQIGVCDLVAAVFDPKKSEARRHAVSGLTVGSLHHFRILRHIKEAGEIHIDCLAQALGKSACIDDPSPHVSGLERMGLLRKDDGLLKAASVSWLHNHSRVIAVELKLSRIEEAYYQALNNLEFAHESWMAMPAENAAKVSTTSWADRLTESGIGLLAVSPTQCRVLIRARSCLKHRDRAKQLHAGERLWRQFIRGKEACTASQSAQVASRDPTRP